MKRLIALLLTAVLCTGLLTGCRQEKKDAHTPTGDALEAEDAPEKPAGDGGNAPEQELSLAYYADRSMNPLVSADFTNRMILSLLYQNLFSVSKDYEAVPVLCGKYAVSEDMRTHVFYVAEGATFSDGTPVRPEDLQATLKFASSPEKCPLYGYRFFHLIDGPTVQPDGGVRLEFSIPYENLPLLLDIPILKASELESPNPLGSGPYVLEKAPDGMRLRRRNNWWCQSDDLALKASTVKLVSATDTNFIRDAFEFDDVGLVCADPGADNYADYRCDYELWDCENGMFLYLGFNTESEELSSPQIRAAITHAIDREKIAEEYYRGFARPASLPASPYSPFYNESLAANYSYDPELFKQTIANAGLKDHEIELMVNGADSKRLRVAKAIAQMLEEGGLKVQVVESSAGNLEYNLNSREYDLYLCQTILPPNMDLTQFFYMFGSLSFGRMDDEGIYTLCGDALANQGNYYNLHKKIMDEGRLCPILFRSYAVYGIRGLISDLNPARDNVFYYTVGQKLRDIQIMMEES